ncbi:YqzL family protein [Bacillus seohaeanensis]|jgi:YqzL-like protein|uniref:YqzL family protein n=1 Tax=Bacillus seohaeanensis TaxID=284580 RepID=A0ABW5RNC5_9BACI
MLDLTWKVFSQTGCIDTYLLFKELEQDNKQDDSFLYEEEVNELDFPIT